jgi:hypothetical protein
MCIGGDKRELRVGPGPGPSFPVTHGSLRGQNEYPVVVVRHEVSPAVSGHIDEVAGDVTADGAPEPLLSRTESRSGGGYDEYAVVVVGDEIGPTVAGHVGKVASDMTPDRTP